MLSLYDPVPEDSFNEKTRAPTFKFRQLSINVSAHNFQTIYNPYYNLRYNPSAPFIRSGFLVSDRIRSAMKFSQNVLHYILNTSRVHVFHMKSLSRYFKLTHN